MDYTNLPAPAKLNLFLHITGRRPDGYHNLQSVFILVDLCDRISLKRIERDEICRHGDIIGDPDKDLCVRAARLLKEQTGCPFGVEITVKKNIPSGAGMGGGSSDAATTLMGLNRLWNLNLPQEELLQMAPKLGADVPFFIFGQNAWAEGIGEQLTPVNIPVSDIEILWPGVCQGTKEIFSHKDLTRDTKPVKIRVFTDALVNEDWKRWGHNDFEQVVRRLNPEVDEMFHQFPQFRLTGSGAAAFLIKKTGDERVVRKKIKKWQHFFVKSLTIHPLLSAATMLN